MLRVEVRSHSFFLPPTPMSFFFVLLSLPPSLILSTKSCIVSLLEVSFSNISPFLSPLSSLSSPFSFVSTLNTYSALPNTHHHHLLLLLHHLLSALYIFPLSSMDLISLNTHTGPSQHLFITLLL